MFHKSQERYEVGFFTEKGKRESNEDSYFVSKRYGIFIVADGMGGHAAGEVASNMVTQYIGEELVALLQKQGRIRSDALKSAIEEIAAKANNLVIDAAEKDKSKKGMGTTLTLAVGREDNLFLANVGDSRAYLLKKDGVPSKNPISYDDSPVQFEYEKGELKEDEALANHRRSIIQRYIGLKRNLGIEVTLHPYQDIDVFALLTDGIIDTLTTGEIYTMMRDNPPFEAAIELTQRTLNPEKVARIIFEYYEKHKDVMRAMTYEEVMEMLAGKDNATAIVVKRMI